MVITDEVIKKLLNSGSRLNLREEIDYLQDVNPNVLFLVDTAMEQLAAAMIQLNTEVKITGETEVVKYSTACDIVRDSILMFARLVDMQEVRDARLRIN